MRCRDASEDGGVRGRRAEDGFELCDRTSGVTQALGNRLARVLQGTLAAPQLVRD